MFIARIGCVALVTILTTGVAARGQAILHVDADAPDGGDGATWANAFNDLQDALDAAAVVAGPGSPIGIWVAAGTYRPDPTGLADPREATFRLLDHVALYGGFPPGGGDGTFDARDPDTHVTVLSGDLNGDDGPRLLDEFIACHSNYDEPYAPGCDAFDHDGDGDVDSQDKDPFLAANHYGENSYHVVTANDTDATALIDGFTITAGHANGSGSHGKGGGFLIEGGNPTITDCTLTGNAAFRGGAVYHNDTYAGNSLAVTACRISGNLWAFDSTVYGDNLPLVTDSTFSDNLFGAMEAGGWGSTPLTVTGCVFRDNTIGSLGGGAQITGPLTMTDCAFIDNSSVLHGGGLHHATHGGPSSPVIPTTISDCIFLRNEVLSYGESGGGMYARVDDQGPGITVSDCTFDGNFAWEGGGVIAFGGWLPESEITLANCTLTGNKARFDGRGGGLSARHGYVKMTGCLLAGNTAGLRGAGICDVADNLIVTNCTISGNAAAPADGGLGGGIYTGLLRQTTVANCILWANRDAGGIDESAQIDSSEGAAVVNYTCIQGGWSGAGGVGNIDDDPLFARNPDSGPDGEWDGVDDDFGDLRLLPGSPCIDAADNTAVPTGVTTDLAGDPRFRDDPDTPDTGNGTPPIVDMGAYEGPTLPTLLRIVVGTDAVDGSATLIWPKAEGVGLATLRIAVDQAVSLVGSSVVTSGGTSTPAVSALTHVGAGIHRVELTEPIPVGHWTIITLTVAGATGAETAFELCLGHLPADINGDGEVNMSDVTEFGVLFRGDPAAVDRDRIDLNGDGQANLNDVTLFGQLWQGTSGHDAWQGASLPAKP